ncbi:unnamed protein product [Symbiodinium sp. CCMP2592]|nr:unnamed protein product [Symbiodinium sp. CCMP2592]
MKQTMLLWLIFTITPLSLAMKTVPSTLEAPQRAKTVTEESITGQSEEELKEEKVPKQNKETGMKSEDHGFKGLAENLEFLLIKVAELETVVELQQIELNDLRKADQDGLSLLAKKRRQQEGEKRANIIFKRVLEKHRRQRENKPESENTILLEGQAKHEIRKELGNATVSGGENEKLVDAGTSAFDLVARSVKEVKDTVKRIGCSFPAIGARLDPWWGLRILNPSISCGFKLMGHTVNLFSAGTRWMIAKGTQLLGSLSHQLSGCSNVLQCIAEKVLNGDLLDKMQWSSVQKLGDWITKPAEGGALRGLPKLVNLGRLGGQLSDCSTNIVECIAGKVLNGGLLQMDWSSVRQLGGYLTDQARGLPQLAKAGMLGGELGDCGTNVLQCIAKEVLNGDLLNQMGWSSVRQLGGYLTDQAGGLPQLAKAGMLGGELGNCGTNVLQCIAKEVLNGDLLRQMDWSSVRQLGGYLTTPAEGSQLFGLPQLVTAGTLGGELEGCANMVECIAGKVLNDQLHKIEWPKVQQLGTYLVDQRSGKGLPQLANAGMLGGELEGCTNMVECIAGKVLNDQLHKIEWPKVQQLGTYLVDQRSGKGLPQLANAGMLGGELEGCANMVECIAGKVLNDQLHKIEWPKVQQLGTYLVDQRSGKGLPQLANAGMLGGELEGCTNMVECIAGKVLNDQLHKIEWPKVQQLGTYLVDRRSGKGHPQLANAGLLGGELEGCTEMVECLGGKIIDQVPPLNHLSRMGDILADVLEGFAKVAATVAGQVLKGGGSLIQQAALSKFPPPGAPPVVHNSGSLVIKTHSQQHKPKFSALQTEVTDDGPTFNFHKEANSYVSKLITQFNGYETDTSSCLAFAPKNKTGAQSGTHSQATATDWQVQDEGDFVALEPWAVPCGNDWMKKNWDKWQGYAFYTSEKAIESCVTVSYGISVQPVVAFVGGVQFDVMPSPLASIETTVCWPTGRDDLSLLRTEIKSSGMLLFSRSLRLSKRFGSNTDFVPEHVHGATSTWLNAQNRFKSISRTKLLQMGRGRRQARDQSDKAEGQGRMESEDQAPEVLEWMQEDEIYLASASYSQDLGINLTSELRGSAATRRLSLAAAETQGVFELFSFQHPGDLVNFKLQAFLNGNIVELGARMGFADFRSSEKRFKLVDIADQFAVVLFAIPFVSQASKDKALEALRDWAKKDVPPAPPFAPKPGLSVALHNHHYNQYLNMASDGKVHSSATHDFQEGLPGDWVSERWTVVDAGHGSFGLHNQATNSILCHDDGNLYGKASSASAFNDWQECRWTLRRGEGYYGLMSDHTKRFVSLGDDHKGYTCRPMREDEEFDSAWFRQQWQFQELRPYLKPGMLVGLYSPGFKAWLRMSPSQMDNPSWEQWTPSNFHDNPDHWNRETYRVVDAGNGEIALYSPWYGRYVGLKDDGAVIVSDKADQLPADWTWARFAVMPAGSGLIALHCTANQRMLRAKGPTEGIDASDPVKSAAILPGSWWWHKWQVVEPPSAPMPTMPSAPEGWTFSAR